MADQKKYGSLSSEDLKLWKTINKETQVYEDVADVIDQELRQTSKSFQGNPVQHKQKNSSAKVSTPCSHSMREGRCLGQFDVTLKRKIKQGKAHYQASLDLHGATQESAYRQLLSFIQGHYKAGVRLLLVITGKGLAKSSREPLSLTPDGILFKALPGWLNTDTFSCYVHSYTLAHREHGGEGAYYIYLRKQ